VDTRERYLTRASEGESVDLGVATMRLLARGDATADGFSLAEFSGGEGPWTVPHVHNSTEESFFVLEGGFTFSVGGNDIEARPGDYVRVPRAAVHVLGGKAGGGRLLVLWVPGGLEQMFLELGRLPLGSIRDPRVRAEIAARHDSVPVQQQA
jgi:quercetin dioxygenase-like cupin family protein